jgi:Wax ester synthase-like Acyl-CoA acyltransferase domain/WS/DGAT C-terminal domain
MQLATGDGRAAGHIGAVLVLDAAPGFSIAQARQVLGERICEVPRLRQRLYRAPPGCGRPYWADDPAFDIDQHVRQVRCPSPGDERALLDLAAGRLGEPLPRSRPLWSATFITGLADGGVGLLVIMDHVLADGIAGLAMLGTLASQATETATAQPNRFPAPAPRARELAFDAWEGRQTFVTNLRGPKNPLQFAGAPVREIILIPATSGNVTVTFAVSSYAGTLRITILSDPDRMPDAPALAAALRQELTAPLTRGLHRG